MDIQDFSRDDLLDVMEMTKKIKSSIERTVKGNQTNLAMSAIMSATINSILSQCSTFQEIQMYRNVFMQIFDASIMNVKIKKKD